MSTRRSGSSTRAHGDAKKRVFNQRFSSDAGVWVQVISNAEPDDPKTEQLVPTCAQLDSPYPGVDLVVTGSTAAVIDSVDAVTSGCRSR